MKLSSAGAFAWIALAAVVPAGCGAATPVHTGDLAFYSQDELAAIYRHTPLHPPPNPTNRVGDNARAAHLGKTLFFDPRLSINDRISCASCHQPDRAFTDGRALAKTLAVGTRNTPTLLNASSQHWFFWDGRTDSMWSQALQVLENPKEFGSDRLHVAHAIYGSDDLRHQYEQIFGAMPPLADVARFPPHARPSAGLQEAQDRAWQGMTAADRDAVNRVFSNVGKVLEAYERKLVSGTSRFDEYVEGLKTNNDAKLAALSPAAKRGLKLFVGAARCELCHSGSAFSDGEFHNIGLPVLSGTAVDSGRMTGVRQLQADPFNGIGAYSDQADGSAKDKLDFLPPPESGLGKFKTPTLRNVALTAPYMHDGRFATLQQVVQFYADGEFAIHGQLVGVREPTLDLVPHLTPEQVSDLVAFLNALSDADLTATLIRKSTIRKKHN